MTAANSWRTDRRQPQGWRWDNLVLQRDCDFAVSLTDSEKVVSTGTRRSTAMADEDWSTQGHSVLKQGPGQRPWVWWTGLAGPR